MTFPTRGESGSDDDRRREEAFELLARLKGIPLEGKSATFVESLDERREQYGDNMMVSPKQLFWLRDLVEKYT